MPGKLEIMRAIQKGLNGLEVGTERLLASSL